MEKEIEYILNRVRLMSSHIEQLKSLVKATKGDTRLLITSIAVKKGIIDEYTNYINHYHSEYNAKLKNAIVNGILDSKKLIIK